MFEGKKITLMGLGLLGRGVGDAAFLAQHGAELIVTDLKTEEELAESVEKLQGYDNIIYRLGEHHLDDFKDRDLIIKAANVPIGSPFLQEAYKNGIRVTQSTALFAEHAKGVTLVGVTGTRGKTTVTQLIFNILKGAELKGNVFLGGNTQGVSTLSMLDEVKEGDIAVLELDSWQLQAFGDAEISPHIAVFTNFYQDHMNYYKGDMERYFEDKANIFRNQEPEDVLVAGTQVEEMIAKKYPKYPGTFVVPHLETVPEDWRIQIPGDHNKENIALALAAASVFDVSDAQKQSGVETFGAVPGRLEFLREVDGVKYYNDNNATSPDATIAALEAVDEDRNVVLIMGGTNKDLEYDDLVQVLPKHCKAVVLLIETGTDEIKGDVYACVGLEVEEADGLPACMEAARRYAEKGDVVLFSPAFASFGKHFVNEYDRGDQFVKLVAAL